MTDATAFARWLDDAQELDGPFDLGETLPPAGILNAALEEWAAQTERPVPRVQATVLAEALAHVGGRAPGPAFLLDVALPDGSRLWLEIAVSAGFRWDEARLRRVLDPLAWAQNATALVEETRTRLDTLRAGLARLPERLGSTPEAPAGRRPTTESRTDEPDTSAHTKTPRDGAARAEILVLFDRLDEEPFHDLTTLDP